MTTRRASEPLSRGRPMLHAVAVLLAGWFVAVAIPRFAAAQNAQYAIWVMKADGSQPRILARVDGAKKHCSPRWSHDGTRVAFSASTTLSRRDCAIYVVNSDGSGLARLGENDHPTWSPDDKQIACEVFQAGSPPSIFVQNLDGNGRVRVCQGEGARWTPDGSRLAVIDQGNVKVVDLVTGDEVMLLKNRQDFIFHGFSWLPDGERLVMSTRTGPSKLRHLLVVSAEGEEHGISERWQGSMGGFNSLAPDGRTLVFENLWTIHTLDLDGTGGPRQLPGQSGANIDPDFSPDGRWIVFASSRDPA